MHSLVCKTRTLLILFSVKNSTHDLQTAASKQASKTELKHKQTFIYLFESYLADCGVALFHFVFIYLKHHNE